MEVLRHFLFQLFKITILGFIYSTILVFIFKKILKYKKVEWFEKGIKSKNKLWFYISIFLFLYMFTPYGNHGLGDSPRIPINFNKAITNANWTEYGRVNGIVSNDKNDIEFTRFIVEDNKLFGNLKSGFYDYKNSYFIYDFSSEKLQEFVNENDYNNFVKIKSLPNSNDLKSFKENYNNYWSSWRLFLLP